MQRIKNMISKDKSSQSAKTTDKTKKPAVTQQRSPSAAKIVEASTKYVKEENESLKKGNELEAIGNSVRSHQLELLGLSNTINASMKKCADTLKNPSNVTGEAELAEVEKLTGQFSEKLPGCKEKYDTYIEHGGDDKDIKDSQAKLALQLNRNKNFFIHPIVTAFKESKQTATQPLKETKKITS